MTQVADTIVFELPPALDSARAAALIADMVKLPQENEISLNAAAISALSLGYLQILASAFKTFPKLTVSGASAEFAELLNGYGIAYPFGEAPAGAPEPPAVAAAPEAELALAPVEIATPAAFEPAIEDVPAEAAPSLVPAAPAAEMIAPAEALASADAIAPAAAVVSAEPVAPAEPVATAQNAAPAVMADSDSEAKSAAAKTVLTIDDSRTMRDMLRLALSGAGFTVVQAVDGQDGLKVLPQQPIDVIITDINMPKLDGYGVIRAVRADSAYDKTPILVLSTEAEQGSKDIANEAGANGWIVKPFDPEGLVKLINTVCE